MYDGEKLLVAWGEWQRNLCGAYREYPGCDLVHRSIFGGQGIEGYSDEECERVDKIVAKMGKPAKLIIGQTYIGKEGIEQVAINFCRTYDDMAALLDKYRKHVAQEMEKCSEDLM